MCHLLLIARKRLDPVTEHTASPSSWPSFLAQRHTSHSVHYVTSASRRGTLDILWSSLFTVISCTWTVQHLNIPVQHDGRDPGILGDIKYPRKQPAGSSVQMGPEEEQLLTFTLGAWVVISSGWKILLPITFAVSYSPLRSSLLILYQQSSDHFFRTSFFMSLMRLLGVTIAERRTTAGKISRCPALRSLIYVMSALLIKPSNVGFRQRQ